MWGRVINTISRMWVIVFWLKPECVTEKTKTKVKLYRKVQNRSIKHIQKQHLNKKGYKGRQKLCRNYNSNVRKYLAYRAQLNSQNAYIIKAALKLESSLTNAATYYFSSITSNASMLLVLLSLNSQFSSSCVDWQDDKANPSTAYLK